MQPNKFIGSTLAAFLLAASSLQADVQLPAIFGDHMILQEGIKIPVWGTASPSESVTVTLGKETASATAGPDGKWRVDLPAVPKNSLPMSLTVKGKNSLTFSDVLIGDVWLCSGQSNMEFNLGGAKGTFGGAANAADVVPQANDPQMRFFVVTKKISLDPVDNVAGKWELCTPESASLFSAVGYFFGSDLRKNLHKPIGLIGSYWGGTPAQAWTSLSGLQKDPPFTAEINFHQKVVANYPKALASYPADLAAYKVDRAKWDATVLPTYNIALKDWDAAAKQASTAGQPVPPRPKPSTPMPKAPSAPEGSPNTPSVLFNGMIAPLVPFAIKGAIWYQGESNASAAMEYRTFFPRLISDWREKWNEGNFPFLYVQLASFKGGPKPDWPFLREAQLMTLSLPNTGMATAVDIGDPKNIHPKDKQDVGHRLALAARHVAYGQDLVYSGPIYQKMAVKGGAIAVSFTHEGTGLAIGKAPWVAPDAQPLPTDKLVGFTICGDDQKWVPADARIEGAQVVVSSPDVPKPVAVRYDWANVAEGNLYNKENLPASPFRTDTASP